MRLWCSTSYQLECTQQYNSSILARWVTNNNSIFLSPTGACKSEAIWGSLTIIVMADIELVTGAIYLILTSKATLTAAKKCLMLFANRLWTGIVALSLCQLVSSITIWPFRSHHQLILCINYLTLLPGEKTCIPKDTELKSFWASDIKQAVKKQK